MNRDKVGCLGMLILIPVVLALVAGIWWVTGYSVVFCVNYLAQREMLPVTNLAYMCIGFLVSLLTRQTTLRVTKD